MNEPRRLIHGGGRPLGRSLLHAAMEEKPSNASMARALAAVAAGTATVAAATSASAAAGAASGASAPVSTLAASAATATTGKAVGSTLAGGVVMKWLGIGVATVALSAGAVRGVEHLTGPTEHAASVATAPQQSTTALRPAPVPSGLPNVEPREETETPSAPEVSGRPEKVAAEPVRRQLAASQRPARTAQPTTQSTEPTGASDIQQEVELLDRVREGIASGDADSALGTLREYEQRFPSGQLGPEMLAMRMDAQLQAGNRAAALESARQLISSSPKSPQATRARQLLSSTVINPAPQRD